MSAGKPRPFDRRSLVFLAATFAITWIAWGSLIVFKDIAPGTVPFVALHLIGGFGPTVAPFIAFAAMGKDERRDFLARVLRWKVNAGWYLIATALVAACGAGYYLYGRPQLQPWYLIFPMFLAMVIGGGLEELGWRGLLLDALIREGRSKLLAGLGVGAVWALWHLPLFYIEGVNQYGRSFLFFAVGVLGCSLMLTVLYAATRSVVLAVFFHALLNASYGMGLMPGPEDAKGAALQGVLLLGLGAAAMAADLVLSKRRRGG